MDVLIQALGAALVIFGIAMWSIPAAFIVAGLVLIAYGILLEAQKKRRPEVVEGDEVIDGTV